jgi:3-hydroxybutyryl-CoA dehydrogenase
MKIEDLRRVLVVGAGTMGQQIALQCAMHDYEVIVYDVSPEALVTASASTKTYAAQLVGQGRLTSGDLEATLGRISFTADPGEGARADLLSESIPEDPDLKARVFAQFNAICPPHTIFTTDTSTLLPSMYAEATGRPAQFAAFHFYQHVWDSNLVDIMPHPGTSTETIQLLYAFAKRIGQVPLVFKKEHPEYVVNAILGAMNNTAFNLVFREGVASPEDVDRAVMIVLKMPSGPFGSLDLVGLDTVWQITQTKAKLSGSPEIQASADQLKREYIDKGWLGVKSGRGFYTYPDPAYARPGFLTGEGGRDEV